MAGYAVEWLEFGNWQGFRGVGLEITWTAGETMTWNDAVLKLALPSY